MAYSPSPLASAGLSHFNHHSVSPPLHQPISKREKRRNIMEDRFAQIGHEFDENRDLYYRKQMHNFHIDIDYIRNANLYANKPLDSLADDASEEGTASAAGSTQGSFKALNLNGNTWLDISLRSGAHANQFAQEINNAMEQRDADLTTVAYHYNFRIDELQRDHEFFALVAHEEHHRLLEILRRRLIQNLNQKKAALQREKEKLDFADTNSLLYHPNQFSLNNGASPGGPQSNRKTRHTRHRLEVEDLDAANGNNKRKRKAPADVDGGSPAPAGRETEPMNAFKEAHMKLEYHQAATPIYSLDRLFSQRELDANLQQATLGIVEDLKRREQNKTSNTNLNSLVNTTIDSSDSEDNADASTVPGGGGDDALLQAPEMERGATNNSQYLTRSTKGLNPKRLRGPESLSYLAGRAAGALTIGTAGQREKKKEDEYQRAPGQTESEIEDDWGMLRAAIEEEDAGKSSQSLLDTWVEEREDHVSTGSIGRESGRVEIGD